MEDQATYGNKDDRDLVPITVRPPRPLWKLMKLHDMETGESMNALCLRLVTEYFKARGKLPKE